MCALLGMDFTQPIFAGFSFNEFGRLSKENADGWGLAWYPDFSASLIKEPIRWGDSPHMDFLNSYKRIRSRIYIAHVRHRTIGNEPCHADTHPFLRECFGRDYCFAHNGTIANAEELLPARRYQRIGNTDSEQIFCHLLDHFRSADRKGLDQESSWRWLHQLLSEINRLGKLNVLLSDGRRLFAYRDLHGWKSLGVSHVYILGQGVHHFEDPSVAFDVEGDALNRGVIVSTEPLKKESWVQLERGELLVVDGGRLKFSTHRQLGSGEIQIPTNGRLHDLAAQAPG